jgi:IS605 OrfB family transposase
MKLTAQLLLDTTPQQADALKRTLRQVNACCDYMSQAAYKQRVFGRFALQKLLYREARDAFPILSAQIIVRAFAKVCDAYALDHKTLRVFKPLGAISYDLRIISFKPADKMVSIWSVDGRLKIPFRCGKRQMDLLHGKRGEADLCLVKGRFYLFVACEAETPTPIDVDGALGVDLGLVSLAVDSDGEVYSGKAVEENRRQFAHRRRNLQRNGTHSAKRKLRSISGKQARFQKDTNHCISKHIVRKAQDTCRAIALEDLGGMRDRVTVRRRQRARHANWSFFDLRSKIEYKATGAGVPVLLVDPRNTSRTCPACEYIDASNRVSQSQFLCKSCGYAGPADYTAAVNIAARAAVMRPMVPDAHIVPLSLRETTAQRQGQATPL